MHNSIFTNPPITDKSFNCTMPTWEEKLDGKLATMLSTMNHNMDKCVEAATDKIEVQTASITTVVGAMTVDFQLSNQLLQSIVQPFAATLPSLPIHNNSTTPPPPCTMEEHYLISKPLRASTTHHQPTITKATTSIMNNFLISSYQWLILLALCTIYICINKNNSSFFYGFLSSPKMEAN